MSLRRWCLSLLMLFALGTLPGCGDAPPAGSGAGTSTTTTKETTASTDKEKMPGDAATAAPGGANGKRFIFLINTEDPFWDACRQGLAEGSKDLGMLVTMESNDGTAAGQIDKLRQFGTQSDIGGIAISVIEADNIAIVEEMRKLRERGVQIITVDGDTNTEQYRDARSYYLGTDNLVAGGVLGTACKALLNARKSEKKGFVQFAGFTDNDNARKRMDGVKKAMGPEYTEVDRMPDKTDKGQARDNVRNALTNHQNLGALIGIWAYNAPAIAEVVEEKNAHGTTVIATFDAQSAAIEFMADGKIDAMVVQNPFDMGYQSVRLLKAMANKDQKTLDEMFPNAGQPNGDVYTTGLRIVAPDDKTPLKPEMFDGKVVEFMKLSAFREWLAKFKLTSS